ncbi:MAG: response regulator [Gammaproteobacteria bacterium]|nr:response regulator [Gammaproteobacteria bacterium]MDP6653909.1 response regulator [Gammaproteobacteria bacterium]
MSSQQAPVILVADDEPDFADIIVEVAKEIGFRTHCVHEGDKVVGEVTAIDPAAIVLDLRMPGADGVEIIRELGKLRCSAKIVLMSGMDQ